MDRIAVFRGLSFPPGGAISCIAVDSVLAASHSSCSYSEQSLLQIKPIELNVLLSMHKIELQNADLTERVWHKVRGGVCIDTVTFEA